jgi:hypothetical protein
MVMYGKVHTRALQARNTWWMTYRDAIGKQRFESCKTTNKKDVEQRLIGRRKENDGRSVNEEDPLCPLQQSVG